MQFKWSIVHMVTSRCRCARHASWVCQSVLPWQPHFIAKILVERTTSQLSSDVNETRYKWWPWGIHLQINVSWWRHFYGNPQSGTAGMLITFSDMSCCFCYFFSVLDARGWRSGSEGGRWSQEVCHEASERRRRWDLMFQNAASSCQIIAMFKGKMPTMISVS